MIRLENVSKFYSSGENNVSLGLHNVSIEMNKGEIIGVIGESGSGKSTFLNVVSMLDTYEEGEIYYNNMPASQLDKKEIAEYRKNHIGFIFQNYNLIDSYTVLQNVMMPLLIKGDNKKEATKKAKELIKRVGLEKRIRHKGTKLSGGEKQRCVIARALASDSEILACDEPTGNLDSKTGREIIELIKEVANDKLVIIVTHNYDELSDVITRRIKFHDGEIIEDVKLKDKTIENDELKPNIDFKFKLKDKLGLSVKDLFSTPKKTIFTFILFVAIAFFTAKLFTGLVTYIPPYDPINVLCNNIDPARIIVTTNSKFDYDDFKDYDYYYASVEDFSLENLIYSEDHLENVYLSNNYNVKLEKGRMPENDNELILGISYDAYDNHYEEEILAPKSFDSFFSTKTLSERRNWFNDKDLYDKLTVVGYYKYKSNSFSNNILLTGTKSFNRRIESIALRYYDSVFMQGRISNDKLVYKYDSTLDDNTIKLTLPDTFKDLDFEIRDIFYFASNYENKIDIDLDKYNFTYEFYEYSIKSDNECFYSISENLSNELFKESTNVISIYESDEIKRGDLINKFSNMGYDSYLANRARLRSAFDIDVIINSIMYVLLAVSTIFALGVIFVISYVVLSKVYSIKNKDYTILRTLGMSEKDMSHIVIIQTIIIGLIATILTLIAIVVSYIINHPIIDGFNRVGIVRIIIYVIFMILFSYLFANRFNKKIFKFSVQKTLRGGVLGND